MKKMTRLFWLLVSTFLLNPMVWARPQQEVTTEYYSDGTYSSLVGERTLTCSGGFVRWGKTTKFLRKSQFSCRDLNAAQTSPPPRARQDAYLACESKCQKKFHLVMCQPDTGDDPCTAKAECIATCGDLFGQEVANPQP